MHPLDGRWIASIDRSRRDPNHQFSQATMRFEVSGDSVTLTYGGVNASGRQEHGAQSLKADGLAHPMPEAPGLVSETTLEPRGLRSIARKDGTVVGQGAYVVSDDGQTMTATVSGIDGSGRPFDQVIAFDRDEQP